MWKEVVVAWFEVVCYLDICLKEVRKTTRSFSKDSRYPGPGLNSGFSDYEAGGLTIRQWGSVCKSRYFFFLVYPVTPYELLTLHSIECKDDYE
jgi:hypothetical protein